MVQIPIPEPPYAPTRLACKVGKNENAPALLRGRLLELLASASGRLELADVRHAPLVDIAGVVVVTREIGADAVTGREVEVAADAVSNAVLVRTRIGCDAGPADAREQVELFVDRQTADAEHAELVVEFEAVVVANAEGRFAFNPEVGTEADAETAGDAADRRAVAVKARIAAADIHV